MGEDMPPKPPLEAIPPDPHLEITLRPALLDQFVGQLRIKERLDVLIAARQNPSRRNPWLLLQ
jgi:Holliday junction resolvasome RuvABC ATP-dependent DNA helicase subunit